MVKTPTERCMLGPVGADQSEQTGSDRWSYVLEYEPKMELLTAPASKSRLNCGSFDSAKTKNCDVLFRSPTVSELWDSAVIIIRLSCFYVLIRGESDQTETLEQNQTLRVCFGPNWNNPQQKHKDEEESGGAGSELGTSRKVWSNPALFSSPVCFPRMSHSFGLLFVL